MLPPDWRTYKCAYNTCILVSFPSSGTSHSMLTYQHVRVRARQKRILAPFPPAGHQYAYIPASACKAKAHSRLVSLQRNITRYAYTPAGASAAHTNTQKRVMAPFTPAGHHAVGLHTGARAGHNAPRSHSPTCASPSTPARTPAQTPPRPLSRAFQPPAPPPSYRNILVRRLTPPQTPHASLRRALQPRSAPSLRAAPRAPSLSRQTL